MERFDDFFLIPIKNNFGKKILVSKKNVGKTIFRKFSQIFFFELVRHFLPCQHLSTVTGRKTGSKSPDYRN